MASSIEEVDGSTFVESDCIITVYCLSLQHSALVEHRIIQI